MGRFQLKIRLILLFLSIFLHLTKAEKACNEGPVDVVFIMDTSESVSDDAFNTEKKYVQNMINSVNFETNKVRVGVLLTSKDSPLLNLSSNLDKQEISEKIDKVEQNGGRETWQSIEFARKQMFNYENDRHRREINSYKTEYSDHRTKLLNTANRHHKSKSRNSKDKATNLKIQNLVYGDQHEDKNQNSGQRDATKIMVLLTDNIIKDPTKTSEEADAARAKGIEIFLVYIGEGDAGNMLKHFASQPPEEHLFKVYDEKRTEALKTAIQCDGCEGQPIDVFFLMDSSSSITREDFRAQCDFTTMAAEKLNQRRGKTRIGVVAYSDETKLVLPLGFHKITNASAELEKIEYLAGGTSTDKAINYVREVGFSRDNTRHGATKIAIVITDGKSRDLAKTAKAAEMAHDDGIYVFTVGVGMDVDEDEMKKIASKPVEEFIFRVRNFSELPNIDTLLTRKSCEVMVADVNTEKTEPTTVHMVFVMDSSSLGHHRSKILLKTIAKVTKDIRHNVELKTDIVKDEDPSDSYISRHKTHATVFRRRVNEDKGLAPLVNFARRYRFRNKNTVNEERILVNVVGEEVVNSESVVLEAKRLKFKNVKVYTLAIDCFKCEKALEDMSSYPANHYVLKFNSFIDMNWEHRKISETILSSLN